MSEPPAKSWTLKEHCRYCDWVFVYLYGKFKVQLPQKKAYDYIINYGQLTKEQKE